MTWTRLDDGWTDSTDFADLDHATRWHYLAMIQFCSRTQKYDGLMRLGDARRCSDVDDPGGAIAALAADGLIALEDKYVRVLRIEEHVPSVAKRAETEQARLRKRRSRAHQAGDHSTCLPATCNQAPAEPADRDSHRDVTRDVGTGRAGAGSSCSTPSEHDEPADPDSEPVDSWPVAQVPAEGPRSAVTGEPWPGPLVRDAAEPARSYCRVGGCANRPLPGMAECVDHVAGREQFEESRARQLAELEQMTGGKAA